MAKDGPKTVENDAGEQLYLMEIHAPEAKAILAVGEKYNNAVSKRVSALKKEVELKDEIRQLVRKLKYTPFPDGSIKLSFGNTEIVVTPNDESVKVKTKKEK